jgi:hypothetical protein
VQLNSFSSYSSYSGSRLYLALWRFNQSILCAGSHPSDQLASKLEAYKPNASPQLRTLVALIRGDMKTFVLIVSLGLPGSTYL